MNPILKQLGVIALWLSSSTIALAQTSESAGSVTLYGLIDTSVRYQVDSPAGHSVNLDSGDLDPTRWGMRGVEPIGGGTDIIFRLESGFSNANGSSSILFGRQATVGVTNPAWGTFKFGRIGGSEIQEDSWDLDPQMMNIFGIVTLVRGRNWTDASNSIEYKSPTMGGLTVKAQYELTNNTSWNQGDPGSGPGQLDGPQGRADGLSLDYVTGSLHLLAIYDEIRDSNGQFDNVYMNSRSMTAGGTYMAGPVKIYTGYQHLNAPQASEFGYFSQAPAAALPSGATLPTDVDHEWLGLQWLPTAKADVMVAWYHANANHGNGNANLWTLGGTYSLSKRTFLYSEVGAVTNSKTSNVGLGNGYSDPYGANVADDPASGSGNFRTNPNFGGSQVGLVAGIVTHF